MEPWDTAVEDAFALLHGKKLVNKGYPLWEKEDWAEDIQTPYSPYHLTEKRILHGYTPVNGKLKETNGPIHMEGRLIGGCLDCLVNLVGTRYDKVAEFVERYKEDGIIWFLESCILLFSARGLSLLSMRSINSFISTGSLFRLSGPLSVLTSVSRSLMISASLSIS